MKQYQQVKSKHPDAILLFRMGDFYETFEDDAKVAAGVLGITLTKRGNGAAGEVPLAGFPHHALNAYLPKLVRAGYRVAVCEQLEDPKQAKGIVRRDVTEVVTPGVAFAESVLERASNNYLCALAMMDVPGGGELMGCAWADVSTGEFAVTEAAPSAILDHLAGIEPSEIVVARNDLERLRAMLGAGRRAVLTKLDDWVFHRDYAYEVLIGHFRTKSLKGFGVDGFSAGLTAAGAVFHYISETQKANVPHLRTIVPVSLSESMLLDGPTKRTLEITSTMAGEGGGSLFSVVDETRTPMGGRMLKQWVHRPLRRLDQILARQERVAAFVADPELARSMRELLATVGDLERMVARASTGRSNPREIAALRRSLDQVAAIRALAKGSRAAELAEDLRSLDEMTDLRSRIGAALTDEPPAAVADGGVVRDGYRPDLDELRSLARGAKDWIARLQTDERKRTGIGSLKIGYNSVFGYYIEVTNAHKDKVPDNYIRKQTLTQAERYITPELKEYEEKVARADERILSIETEVMDELREAVAASAAGIQQNGRTIARLDCLAGLAELARRAGYVRPVLNDGTSIRIRAGRHPVIERLLPPGDAYQPNDCTLDTENAQVLVLTGPNMSGKSSYLRQVGLIVLLAQTGSFVPAESAEIGVVDRIFTRVGASDNISEGESTFLVEMQEAAHIVHAATRRSLILLDEVGRGTSTFDGISIAWALTEYLHERVGAKTLFATHYHELNQLEQMLPRVRNAKVDVREYGDKVVFLHKVVEGFADHSYGIHVAQMAGMPREITDRAAAILRNLEATDLTPQGGASSRSAPADQMRLFEVADDALRREIEELNIDSMTPMEALQHLHRIRERIRKERRS